MPASPGFWRSTSRIITSQPPHISTRHASSRERRHWHNLECWLERKKGKKKQKTTREQKQSAQRDATHDTQEKKRHATKSSHIHVYLPVRLPVDVPDNPLRRTYDLSRTRLFGLLDSSEKLEIPEVSMNSTVPLEWSEINATTQISLPAPYLRARERSAFQSHHEISPQKMCTHVITTLAPATNRPLLVTTMITDDTPLRSRRSTQDQANTDNFCV